MITEGQVLDVINPFLLAILSAIAAVATSYINRYVKSKQLDQGMNNAAGYVYSKLVSVEGGVSNTPIKNRFLVEAGALFLAHWPGVAKTFNITPDTVTSRVEASLGKLLSADPTISVSPAALPAPANVAIASSLVAGNRVPKSPPST